MDVFFPSLNGIQSVSNCSHVGKRVPKPLCLFPKQWHRKHCWDFLQKHRWDLFHFSWNLLDIGRMKHLSCCCRLHPSHTSHVPSQLGHLFLQLYRQGDRDTCIQYTCSLVSFVSHFFENIISEGHWNLTWGPDMWEVEYFYPSKCCQHH